MRALLAAAASLSGTGLQATRASPRSSWHDALFSRVGRWLGATMRPVATARRLSDAADARDTLLTPAEVAELFRVDPKTVTRWAKAGLLDAIRTLGGHRRYRRAQVMALLANLTEEHGP